MAVIQTHFDLDRLSYWIHDYVALNQFETTCKVGTREGIESPHSPYPGVTSISLDLLGKMGKATGWWCTQWHCYLQHCSRLVKVVTRRACLTSCGENYGMDCHGNRPDVTIWACVFQFCLFLIFRLEDLDREECKRKYMFSYKKREVIILENIQIYILFTQDPNNYFRGDNTR